ncbi:TonB-dependent receptor [Adhaeribacter swui]|uniref:TonB-dependent receptor n=1 Tax=Adhaeribacter swui TaxID=2086471 RepID=A0A7G7G9E1_9BACT|nr:TonB-dependent receptor [Adhaeribacter swui]QNF33775.1 TonB-dependent receptor [Adhaeribacter swui]
MRLLYFLTFFILSISVYAQRNGSIGGKITSSDGTPAEFVNVALKGSAKGATVDKRGRYVISGVVPGSYTVVASFVGLETQEQTVEVVAGQQTIIDFILKENSAQLQEIVISGSRDNYKVDEPSSSLRITTPLLETPQNIQVVTKDVLRDQQVISMSDGVIRNVSGAYRSEHWADLYTNIVARGSQMQAFRNGFNAVNSYWGPLTEDMAFVDHIEFVKGPAGFMLSNGEPSGLYNVVTKKPTGRSAGEVAFTVGSFDLYRTSLDLDGRLSKDGRILYRLNLAAQNRKSHRANEYNDRYVIAPVISYQLDDKTKLTAEYTYQRANMSNVGSFYVFDTQGFATLPVNFTMLPTGLPGSTINDHSAFINLQHDINEKWKLTAQVARFNYYALGSSAWPNSISPDGKIIRGISSWEANAKMTMGQVFLNGEFNTGAIKHRVLGGLDMANKQYIADWGQSHALDTVGGEFDIHNPNNGVPNNGYPQFDFSTPLEQRAFAIGANIDQRYAAGYLQDELGFFENKLRLTLAGRYTYVKQAYGPSPIGDNHFTPRVGLSASITPSTSVYALYDQAFTPQNGIKANGEAIQPLTGNNLELGFKRDWLDGKWNTTVSLYRILKNNEAVADPTAPPSSGIVAEIGQKQSQGIEFDLRGTILPGLTLTANYALTESKVTKTTGVQPNIQVGDIVPGFARHTANAWANYTLQNGVVKGFGVSGGFTLLSGRETYWDVSPDPSKTLPTYFKLDGGVYWSNNKIRIAANVYNILDDYLYSGSYYSWLNAYYTQTDPPRNVRLSVNYRF